jgi:hypothetical protein
LAIRQPSTQLYEKALKIRKLTKLLQRSAYSHVVVVNDARNKENRQAQSA